MNIDFLPIGSIILLKGGTKKIMITGFCSIAQNNKHKLYDYIGCYYPEGVINSDEVCMFNNDQISNILFKGFDNQEEVMLKDKLKDKLKNITLDSDHNIVDKVIDANSEPEFFVDSGLI